MDTPPSPSALPGYWANTASKCAKKNSAPPSPLSNPLVKKIMEDSLTIANYAAAERGLGLPPSRPSSLVVGCLQFTPVTSETLASIAIADSLLSKHSPSTLSSLDVLVLPEMAFSGYNFKDRSCVPLETSTHQPSVDWAKRTAKRLSCVVCCGYPRLDEDSLNAYNSMVVVGADGSVCAIYDKHHLFATDKTWATPGTAFHPLLSSIPGLPSVTVALGICMDINPHEFEAPFDAYELATHSKTADLLLFSSNWCSSHPDDSDDTRFKSLAPEHHSAAEKEKILETVNYWCSRLKPLLRSPRGCHFVCADRTGTEPASLLGTGSKGDVQYVGCSCVLDLKRVAMVANLDMHEQGLLVTKVNLH